MAREIESQAIIERAVTHVKIYHPFYGALIHRLKVKLDRRHKSLYCDAVVLGFNPDWVVQANWDRLLYVLVHCVQHCAMRHPFRRGDRDPKLYGEATDHVVNLSLAGDESLALHYPPQGSHEYCGPRDERFKSLAAEQVYSVLYTEQPPQQQEKSDDRKQKEKEKTEMKGLSQSAAGDCGDAGASGEPIPKEDEDEDEDDKPKQKGDGEGAKRDANPEAEQKVDEEEGQPDEGSPLESEEQSEGAGEEEVEGEQEQQPDDEPEADGEGEGEPGESEGDLEIGEAGPSPADVAQLEREWGEAVMTAVLAAGGEVGSSLQRALGEAGKVRQSFDEYIDVFAAKCFNDAETWKRSNRRYSDTYLPSRSAPVVRKLLAGVDVSGSISDNVLRKFEVALQRVADEFGCAILVAFCDTKIRKEQEFAVGDTIALEPEGGGGTRFSPVFERYLELTEAGEDLAGVIYLTDLEGSVGGWQKYMEIETLWVSTETDPDKLFMELPHFGTVCNIHD
jgi:predicted metal-dependent peptidase